jgi:hypothetical protein
MTDGPKPPPPAEASRLAVLVDGAPLDPDAARALWTEFSAHMDEHRGDMAGFAKKKGWKSVAPEYQKGRAVLVVKTGAMPEKPAAPPKPPHAKPPHAKKAPPPKKKGPPPKKRPRGTPAPRSS